MQTLRKKTSPLKYRNEPARFFGDGVVFKAKLIGILEVGEARGDRMCQEALQDLKIAIRAAGEHKQRITIHVTIEGLRLRDEKTGESLYHHPVHKISFIAQDMTDSRAFGYIFGSPDCGHRFFGIKTDKAASQVVLAMRDLFQCVFELKKKEIELAKQHIQNRITAHEHQQIKNSILEHKKTTSSLLSEARSTPKPEKSPETTANLVDLEQELSSIQRGITQMERITPNDDAPTKNVLDDDPFGDSFSTSFSSTPFNILPPPSTAKSRSQQQKQSEDDPMSDLIIGKTSSNSPLPQQNPQSSIDSWLQTTQTTSSSIFKDNSDTTKIDDGLSKITKTFDDNLDPLGTGKSKPYVDKKYFFQDLKNPPKKVLKDLSEHDSIFDAHFSPLKRPIGIQGFSLDSSLTTGNTSLVENSKIIDQFDDEDFSKINIDQLESSSTTTTKSISPNQKSIILPDTKISSISEDKPKIEDKLNDFKSFSTEAPTESWASPNYSDLRRQGSDGSVKNVFSVDSFSKKLPKPNIFGQRNVKRDSNGINMRRLQESDSLSENEPELPPRLPDSSTHEPPPLPPKNQKDSSSNEQIDRHRFNRVPVKQRESRYDYANKFNSNSSDSPPIPLPSRKINRTEISISSKSSKKSNNNDDDDYLTPNPSHDSFPTLPPPPPSKFRGPKKSDTDPKNLDAPTPPISARSDYTSNPSSIIPDITLSQLLTLGIDDLAHKLNVPPSKLNTMTLVELTTYLAEFIEKSKQTKAVNETPLESPVFKVNFDDAVFEAKFDDNFGEIQSQTTTQSSSFVANFDHFNQPPISVIPTADRYAVFREIIDQDIQQSFDGHHQESIESNNSNSMDEGQDSPFDFARGGFNNQFESPLDNQFKQSPITTQSSKIDNKITEALSGVKDRYAALRELRNIVLVEDLFDKSPKPPLASISDSNLSDDIADDNSSFNQQVFETAEVADNNSLENVPTYSISWADAEDNEGINSENTVENQIQLDDQPQKSNLFSTSNKDDLEIDEYMNKAISELSLDQRLSPNIQSKSSPHKVDEESNFSKQSSPLPVEQRKLSPSLNDMMASPNNVIQVHESKLDETLKADFESTNKNTSKENIIEDAIENNDNNNNIDDSREKTITPNDVKPVDASESWAVFEQDDTKVIQTDTMQGRSKQEQESNSSDGKPEWKIREKEYHKRWPKPPHTSSSSREASPWDDDPSDQRKRSHNVHPPPPHYHSTDRYARPPAPRRRMNSHEEEYDDDYERRRVRVAAKPPIHRSKEMLENENWYHNDQHWYPDEEDDEQERMERTPRPFDRNAYERSTYGPPYDKRDSRNYQGYDRRAYDKRSKYYRSYNRPEYDYEHPYDMPPPPPPTSRGKPRKEYDEYEGNFERGARETRSAREYFYDRDRRSFDSNESYDSGRMNRMNSGELHGSYESGRGDYRERYASQGRMSRRNQRSRGTIEDDSDEVPPRRPSGDTGSLQRPQGVRTKHSNIKLDDEVWGNAAKYWKRPASATAGDRMSGSGGLSGSDGERDKRHRRKTRQRSKEVELRSNYATIRYPGQEQRRKEYYDFEDDPNDEPVPSNASPRFQAMDSRDYYAKKKQQHATANVRTSTTPRSENKSFSEYVKPRYASPYEDSIGDENFDEEHRGQGKNQNFKKSTSKDIFIDESKEHFTGNNDVHQKRQTIVKRTEFSSEEQSTQPPVPQPSNKFAFDGFESDFTTSPKQQNDQKSEPPKFTFEEREFSSVSPNTAKNGNSQQKLRFNENVSVSKFDKNASSQQMFEDDFLQSWTPSEAPPTVGGTQMQSSLKKTAVKGNVVFTRQENIKKSDSVNIFARKSDEDPFENDDFFSGGDGGNEKPEEDPFHWDSKNNFANFDDNKNI
ncbi:unnamed protein product [Chironomus riparius]|uniref:PID domain-containing protein n=1 Tax=Chironomus riparius TaxID=315576 RepID=A0A9P0IU00_9DIPT|nr:unnamed protein product [Chironomus riparius]